MTKDLSVCILGAMALVACGKNKQQHLADVTVESESLPGPLNDVAPNDVAPIDADDDYPSKAEILYLSGRGSDDAVPWDFMINTGRRSGVWSKLPVPSNWEFHGFGEFQYGFSRSNEVGTYRRTFERPARWSDKRVTLVFEGSMTDTQVLLNGAGVGPVHQGGFYRFAYDVTDALRDGSNDLEVVVSKESANASVNAAERQADYWTFGGIFRPVYLEATPRAAIERFAVDARADGSLSVDVLLRGVFEPSTLKALVLDEELVPVGRSLEGSISTGEKRITLSGKFPGIEPWSAESPRRYRLSLELETESGTRHAVRENFGFRTIEVRPGRGVYVNGRRILLRGVNRHSFWPDSGRALSSRISALDVELLKGMNANAVRSSHYPPDKHFLDQADRVGLYVMDELGGWQGAYDEEVGRTLVREMVTFDVNHPSILFWANGNEGGWNTSLDGDFARLDPQRRPVLHPWATFGDLNTDHYESYESTLRILSGPTLFMPTEFLHGLYDGGGGAGLDDYWRAISSSPRGAGGFLWAFVDEGVKKGPKDIDTAGNAAPDGILGPYREKEGSYSTIRQIWSPVQLGLEKLPRGFDGQIPVENHYDATDLNSVVFEWRLVRFDVSSPKPGHRILKRGLAHTGSIAPQARGTLKLPLSESDRGAHALLLEARDAKRRLVGKWSFMLKTAGELRAEVVDEASKSRATLVSNEGESLVVTASGTTFTFSKSSGYLTGVEDVRGEFPLRNGPSLSVGDATLESLSATRVEDDYVLTARYARDRMHLTWRVMGNGWLHLAYRYQLEGEHDFFGVDFDCAETEVKSVQWLGRGPHRVWKNRMRGPSHDMYHREKNRAVTGQRWDYPEFRGYFADVHFARLITSAGPIDIVVDSPDLFLRLFTPESGPDPRSASMSFPAQDISFLHGISPIGDKFLTPADTGPAGAAHDVRGIFEGSLYFRFGRPAR